MWDDLVVCADKDKDNLDNHVWDNLVVCADKDKDNLDNHLWDNLVVCADKDKDKDNLDNQVWDNLIVCAGKARNAKENAVEDLEVGGAFITTIVFRGGGAVEVFLHWLSLWYRNHCGGVDVNDEKWLDRSESCTVIPFLPCKPKYWIKNSG